MKNLFLAFLLIPSICAAQLAPPPLNGDVTQSVPNGSTTIATGAVTDSKASLESKPSVGLVAVANLTLSGAQTIDGVAGTVGTTLVLATAQSTASQNGPWIMQAGAWTRPAWYPSGGTTQALQFSTTLVRLGTTYQGTTWRQTTAPPITIDTTATTWVITPLALNASTVGGTGLPLANLASNIGPYIVGSSSTAAPGALSAIPAGIPVDSQVINGATQFTGTFSGATVDPTGVSNNSTALTNAATAAAPGLLFYPFGTYSLTSNGGCIYATCPNQQMEFQNALFTGTGTIINSGNFSEFRNPYNHAWLTDTNYAGSENGIINFLVIPGAISYSGSYQKSAARFEIWSADNSSYSPNYLHDSVAFQSYASTILGVNNAFSRVWGGDAWTNILFGSDGYLNGFEFDLNNQGSDQPLVNQSTSKRGLGITTSNSIAPITAAIQFALGGGSSSSFTTTSASCSSGTLTVNYTWSSGQYIQVGQSANIAKDANYNGAWTVATASGGTFTSTSPACSGSATSAAGASVSAQLAFPTTGIVGNGTTATVTYTYNQGTAGLNPFPLAGTLITIANDANFNGTYNVATSQSTPQSSGNITLTFASAINATSAGAASMIVPPQQFHDLLVAPHDATAGYVLRVLAHNSNTSNLAYIDTNGNAGFATMSATTVEAGSTALAPPANIQAFSYTGSGQTWTKPAAVNGLSCQTVEVIMTGGGGGGGAGAAVTSGTNMSGGGGGGGANLVDTTFPCSALTGTVTLTLGNGGAQVAGVTGNNPGTNGNFGATSTFGTFASALGGGGGAGGQSAGNSGGGSGGNGATAGNSSTNGTGGTAAGGGGAGGSGAVGAIPTNNFSGSGGAGGPNAAAGVNGGTSFLAGAGGASGGGLSSTPSSLAGGTGGKVIVFAAGGTSGSAGTNPGGPGNLATGYQAASGGGGGGSSATSTGGAGGAGGACGGGGGGGGAAISTQTSGVGGAGGAGCAWIITRY